MRVITSYSIHYTKLYEDVGPLGVRLAPFGRVQLEDAREAFKEQISTLIDAGVDVIIIETMTDFYEVRNNFV